MVLFRWKGFTTVNIAKLRVYDASRHFGSLSSTVKFRDIATKRLRVGNEQNKCSRSQKRSEAEACDEETEETEYEGRKRERCLGSPEVPCANVGKGA